jgi:hypothetical protein
MKENEVELIAEIAHKLRLFYRSARGDALGGFYPDDWTWVDEMAKMFIARILKAVVDGLPLPGEVGRDKVLGWNGGIVCEGDLEIQVEVGDLLIALRKEEEK